MTFAALFVIYNLGMVCRAGRDKQAESRGKAGKKVPQCEQCKFRLEQPFLFSRSCS